MGQNDDQQPLSVGEFARSMRIFHKSINDGFERIDNRFDAMAETQSELGERVAVLEEKPAKDKRRSATWTTAIASGIVGIIEVVRYYLGKS